MTRLFSGLADVAPPDPAKPPLASWYTPGLSDALGDRLLMFDNTTSSPLELLRFKPEFSRTPGFEAALRDRVEELASFEHESVAKIRAVKWLGDGEGLTLVSNQIVGRRLSDLLGEVQGPGLALELIRQLSPVLAALHERGIAHGLLTPERIVITPDGRVVLCEHVLGSAFDGLNLSSGWMRSELGLAVPSGDARVPLDGRSDVVQLGMIALSLGLGQRLQGTSYPEHVGQLIDDGVARGALPSALRLWLDRALHLVWPPFASALEATAALDELPEPSEVPRHDRPEAPEPGTSQRRLAPARNVIALRPIAGKSARTDAKPLPAAAGARPGEAAEPSEPPTVVPVNAPIEPFFPDEAQFAFEDPHPPEPPRIDRPVAASVEPARTQTRPSSRTGAPDIIDFTEADRELSKKPAATRSPTFFPQARKESQPPRRPPSAATPQSGSTTRRGVETPEPAPATHAELMKFAVETASAQHSVTGAQALESRPMFGIAATEPAARERQTRIGFIHAKWFTTAAVIVAIAEAVIIAGLLYTGFASSAGSDQDSTSAASDLASASAGISQPPTPDRDPAPPRGTGTPAPGSATPVRPAGPERTGTVQFTSSIALDVFENGTRIGSTAAPIALPAGRHTLEVVSETLGYRAIQAVTVAAGRNIARAIAMPQGRVNINASPWAHVSIDGKVLGDTPLANVAVPIGSHEVVFRHPVFGEVRRTAVVKADGVTRVSANMQQR